MKNIIQFKDFIKESASKTFIDLVHENIYEIEDSVYHGTPLNNMIPIITNGLVGNKHGELDDYSTVSTSLNSEMIQYFSEGANTGFCYDLDGQKAFIIPDWMKAILDTDSGARTYDNYEEDELIAYCTEYNLPIGRSRFDDEICLPQDFLSNNLPEGYIGCVYEYVAEGRFNYRDEAEIIIMGKGVEKINSLLYSIYINGKKFYDKDEAIEYLRETYSQEQLEDSQEYEEEETLQSVKEEYYAGEVFADSDPTHKSSLYKAKEMEGEGAAEDDILSSTNWFKGKYDNKWRIEMVDRIDLSRFPFSPYNDPQYGEVMEGCATVADIVLDKQFIQAYPRIAAVEVQLMYAPTLHHEAEYTPSKSLIFAQHKTPEAIIPYLVHEIQHAIQTEEDFARGGEPNMFNRDEKGRMRSLKDKTSMYMSLAGEIEARDVQARTNYSTTQRKHIKPFSSEDYPRDSARITYDD